MPGCIATIIVCPRLAGLLYILFATHLVSNTPSQITLSFFRIDLEPLRGSLLKQSFSTPGYTLCYRHLAPTGLSIKIKNPSTSISSLRSQLSYSLFLIPFRVSNYHKQAATLLCKHLFFQPAPFPGLHSMFLPPSPLFLPVVSVPVWSGILN